MAGLQKDGGGEAVVAEVAVAYPRQVALLLLLLFLPSISTPLRATYLAGGGGVGVWQDWYHGQFRVNFI